MSLRTVSNDRLKDGAKIDLLTTTGDGGSFLANDGSYKFVSLTGVSLSDDYTTTNVTLDREYNAKATTIDELSDVLGTVIADMKVFNGINLVNDTAYGIGWEGDTTSAPSKNAVYDKIETLASLSDISSLVDNTAYDVSWNGDIISAPSKNSLYDKIETLATQSDIAGMATISDISTVTINAQTGITYTLSLGDGINTLVTLTNSSPVAVTIPTNATVAFPIGTKIDCIQAGAGKVTFSGAGVTILSISSYKSINGQYVGVSLIKTAVDTWILIGNLIA